MNGMELSPDETVRTGNASFKVDPLQRLDLHYKFRDLATELSENVMVTPFTTTTEYAGIPIGSLKHGYGTRDVSIKVTNPPQAPPTTEIILSAGGPGKGEQRTYRHFAPFDAWEERRASTRGSHGTMSTAFLVDALRRQLPPGAFDIDQYPNPEDASDIVLLLSGFLALRARSHLKRVQYKAQDIQVGGELYMSARETDFIVKTKGNRITRALFVASSYSLFDGPLRKTYGYEVVEKNFALDSVKGSLELKADDRFSQLSLDELAHSDVTSNDPFLAAQFGINDIRGGYGLTQLKR